MLKEHAWAIAAQQGIEASGSAEPQEGEAPDFVVGGHWVQNADNQRAMLDGFAKDLSLSHSLVFFYAKQTSMSDRAGRQIVAVAKLHSIGQIQEYPYEGGSAGSRIRSAVWERPFQHSLRPDPNVEGAWLDGVVLPYQKILALSNDTDINPSEFIAEVPAD